ncbi:YesL family protein [Bifidobacterium thermacidophilum]|uniref:Transferase n=1 Tax=Bifidobacterium thermacidophilum subsp. thermacidophilum TaxID=79262 RepID=A0A087E2K1_9BIFI|nr:YesL family protein [Bifidobacterium thermacidophilum]KFJ02002.1 hypothetical protein THER5_0175 [Bifidobacterium thermacidophilum subsp. thermacidophilum]
MPIFDQDNPFNDFMSHLGDMAMANVAWAVCSLPVVTIGASTSALFDVARAIDEGDDSHVLKRFWSAFTRRIGTTLLIGIIYLAFLGLIAFDMWYTSSSGNGDLNAINYGICIAIGIIGAICSAYVLPLASRSNLPAGGQFKRSAALVAAHPVAALSAFALAAIPCIIAVWMPGGLFFVIFFWGLLFAGCSSWLTAVLMRQQRVFADPLVTVDEAPTAARR